MLCLINPYKYFQKILLLTMSFLRRLAFLKMPSLENGPFYKKIRLIIWELIYYNTFYKDTCNLLFGKEFYRYLLILKILTICFIVLLIYHIYWPIVIIQKKIKFLVNKLKPKLNQKRLKASTSWFHSFFLIVLIWKKTM